MNEKFKVRAVKHFIIFLAAMFVMTFISRMVYTNKLPRVSTTTIKNQALSHKVMCSGTIESEKNIPIIAESGLRVSDVMCKYGDMVSKNDVIMRFDIDSLRQKIESMENEVESKLSSMPGAYENINKLPIFTESGLRVYNVCVRSGDHVDAGQILLEFDADYVNNKISKMQQAIDSECAARDECYERDDRRSGDALNDSIENAQREIDRFYNIVNNDYKIYSNISGVITDVNITTGALTSDAAVFLLSTDPQYCYDISQQKEHIEKLKALLDTEGNVVTPTDGIVTYVGVRTGEFTTDSPVFMIANSESGAYFKADLSDDDAQYISIGDVVDIVFRNGKIRVYDAQIEKVICDDMTGIYRLEIPLENKELQIGEIGQITTSTFSNDMYDCLPRSAVHFDNGSESEGFIYVIEEIEGFLGTEQIVHKEQVSVVDRNEKYFGISGNVFKDNQKIVLSASKSLSEGQQVRSQ